DTFRGSLRPFFAMNSDLFVRSLGLIAVYIGFTVISARYGDMMLAVSSIIMKLLMIFSYFTDGFAYAGEALTGRFIGERNQDGLHSTVRGVFAWGAAVVVLFLAVYAFAGTPIFRLMTSDESVVAAGAQFLPWLLAMPLIGCPAFIWDGIFIGATASADMRNSSVLCALGFFAAWFLGLLIAGRNVSQETAIHILMAAYFVHLAIRTIYLSVRYKSQIKI
ncbi:MAG: MATE family efflux transporter, partial [Bacteroidales bacterium]|nr:MATE family efflux transporter [Bacteroidales bacterium]